MNKAGMGAIFVIAVIMSFTSGYYLGGKDLNLVEVKQKPVLGIEEKSKTEVPLVNENSKIIHEKEYKLCKHVIISEFEGKQELMGKNLEEIRHLYRSENGFTVSFMDDTLVIHQIIDDWCPQDKDKCRLKEYKGMVAIYKGANKDDDILMRVTSISMGSLPEKIQAAIRSGQYEFDNQQLLNDALENLDEY